MTIVRSYFNSVQSPRGPQKQQPTLGLPQAAPRFGRVAAPEALDRLDLTYRPNGVWVTNERLPVKTGGLGEVSYTISKAIARFGTPENETANRDFRLVVPYLKLVREQDKLFKELETKKKNGTITKAERLTYAKLQEEYGEPFHPTNLKLTAMVKGKRTEFQVMQAFEPLRDSKGRAMVGKDGQPKGNMVYALKNDSLFSNAAKIDTYDSMSKNSLELLTPFNQAAGKLIPYLDGTTKHALPQPKGDEQELKTFNGSVNYVVGNDWLTGSVLYQPGVQGNRDIRKIFYLHNTYDSGALPAEEAGYDRGWPLPSHLTKAEDLYSHLTLSLKSADAAVANKNFVKTLTRTDFAKGQKFVAELQRHVDNNTVFDMHHALADDFTPISNPYLCANQDEYVTSGEEKERGRADAMKKTSGGASYQFQELKKNIWGNDNWAQFKHVNKLALQKKYSLNADPNAIVMNWAARLEPNQKGFYLLQHTIEKLLDENPKLQILIAGNAGGDGPNERKIIQWVNDINAKPEYKGRIYIPNAFVSKREITQMNAGSDFTILPSLYEPYGLTQLEAIKMGSIPLVNGVDGLRTTVSDPEMNGQDFIGRKTPDDEELVWKYGQTGILMGDINVVKYRGAIARQHLFTELEDKVKTNGGQYKLNGETKESFKNLRETLTNILPELKNETCKPQVEALLNRLGKQNAVLPANDLNILDQVHSYDQKKYINPAEAKFATAVNRAVELVKDGKLSEVRANGLKFLEENHNWKEIFDSRYRNLLDAKMDPKTRGTVFQLNEKPPFPRTKKNGMTGDGDMPEGFLAKTWYQFKAAVATIIYYLNISNWFKKPGRKDEETVEKTA